jgi:hypothetical protein
MNLGWKDGGEFSRKLSPTPGCDAKEEVVVVVVVVTAAPIVEMLLVRSKELYVPVIYDLARNTSS